MKDGRQFSDKVQGYHGRPMCCAEPMQAHSVNIVKRDLAAAQKYRCPHCGKLVTLYFNADGTLHHDQTPRDAGRFQRTYH